MHIKKLFTIIFNRKKYYRDVVNAWSTKSGLEEQYPKVCRSWNEDHGFRAMLAEVLSNLLGCIVPFWAGLINSLLYFIIFLWLPFKFGYSIFTHIVELIAIKHLLKNFEKYTK